MNKQAETTVIVGGNGKTGSRVAARLEARGQAVRLASRSSQVPFDWSDASSWRPALSGARAAYLTYYPDLAVPGAADQVRRVAQAAVECGVQRIVLLAGRGEPQVKPAEDAVRQCGAEFTILECAFFSQNFSEGLAAPVNGAIAFPAGNVAEPFIDCDDIADVAVAALTEVGHHGKTYELTGPRALSFADACSIIAAASGKPIEFLDVSFSAYAEMLSEHLPPPQVEFFIELFRFLLDGHNANTTDDVERVLGRPAKSLEDYARDARKAWQA